MGNYRTCAGSSFNSGIAQCPLNPGHVKAIVLTEHGYMLPSSLTAANIEAACHADRPNRIYPLKEITEFSPEGGEVQTSDNGYGGTKIVGYSAFSPTWTLAENDFNLRQQIVKAKGSQFDAYFIDDNNMVYGQWVNGDFAGVPLAGIAQAGNLFDTTSGSDQLTITTYVKDYEKWIANIAIQQVDFDIVGALGGLVYVKFEEQSVTGTYKLIDVADNLDVTAYYGSLLQTNAATAMPSATSVSYDATTNILTVVGTAALAAPSVLQGLGITGIEEAV